MKFPIHKSSFIRNTLNLLLGNLGAQLISFITIPIITRIYLPDSYGILTLFISCAVIIEGISSLRLESVVLITQEEDDALNILVLCFLLIFFFAILITIIALFLSIADFHFPLIPNDIAFYLFLIALSIFFSGLYKALSFWAIRKNYFGVLGISVLSNSGVSKIFSIAYGLTFNSHPVGLICGFIAGNSAAIVIVFFKTIKKDLTKIFKIISIDRFLRLFSRYRTFAIYSPIAVFEGFSKLIAPLMLSIAFGPTVVGFFGLAQSVVQRPLTVIGDAVSRSFFKEVSSAHHSNLNYDEKSEALFKGLFSLTFIAILSSSIIAPDVFGYIFGHTWKKAGVYFAVLSFSFLSDFLYRPFSIIFDIQERQKLRFQLTILKMSVNILSIGIGMYLESPFITMIIFSFSNTVLNFCIIILLLSYSGVHIKNILRYLFFQFGIASTIGTLIIFSKSIFALENIFILFLLTIIFNCIYLLLLFKSSNDLKGIIEQFTITVDSKFFGNKPMNLS